MLGFLSLDVTAYSIKRRSCRVPRLQTMQTPRLPRGIAIGDQGTLVWPIGDKYLYVFRVSMSLQYRSDVVVSSEVG